MAGDVGIVILAAGSSRRLGRPKQTLPLHGKALLQHVIDAARAAAVGPIVVVLGHEAEAIRTQIALPGGARVVVNADHASGQASSLHTGIASLDADVERAVVLLGDQPGIDPDVICAVAAGPGPIRRAVYADGPAHPVAFDRSIWTELVAVEGDRGARGLITADPRRVIGVPVAGAAPRDIDTPSDAREVGVVWVRES